MFLFLFFFDTHHFILFFVFYFLFFIFYFFVSFIYFQTNKNKN